MEQHIFISHSSKNDDVVKRLREILELEGFLLWVDSREFTGGDILEDTLQEKIKTAKSFIILLSIEALSSEWVQKELKLAHKVAKERNDEGSKWTLSPSNRFCSNPPWTVTSPNSSTSLKWTATHTSLRCIAITRWCLACA